MTLEILQREMTLALKRGNKIRKEVLSGLVDAVKKAAIDNKCRDNISEALVNTILIKEQKTMQEMIDTCPSERIDTLKLYHEKMEIIKEFAPQLINDPIEIKNMIKEIFSEIGIEPVRKNKGVIMKSVMPRFKGKADMSIVSKVIEEMLS